MGLLAACGGDGTAARTGDDPGGSPRAVVAPAQQAPPDAEVYDLLANGGSVEVGGVPGDLDEALASATGPDGELRQAADGTVDAIDGTAASDVPTDALVFQNELEPEDDEGFRRLVVAVLPADGYGPDEMQRTIAEGQVEALSLPDGRAAALRHVSSGELSVEVPGDTVSLFVNGVGLTRDELVAVAGATRVGG